MKFERSEAIKSVNVKRILTPIWFYSLLLLHAAETPFTDCLPTNPDDSLDETALRCIYGVSQNQGLWEEGAKLIRGYWDRDPNDPWLPYFLGHFELKFNEARAAETFGKAAAGFHGLSMYLDTMKSLDRQALAYERLGNLAAFDRVMTEIEALQQESNDPILSAYVFQSKANRLLDRGQRLDLVLGLLADAEELAFPDGPHDLQLAILRDQYTVAWDLGLEGLVNRTLTRLTELAEARNSAYDQALAHYRWATLAVLEVPGEATRQEALEKAEFAYEMAESGGSLLIRSLAAILLGKLTRGERRVEYYRKGIEFAEMRNDYPNASAARAWLVSELAESDPDQAKQYLEQMFRDNEHITNARDGVFGWEARMKARWAMLDPAEALESSLYELALIETLRDYQSNDLTQIRLFQIWSRAFLWLSGRLLLENQNDPAFNYLAEAFHLAERVRSRTLLETLDGGAQGAAQKTNEPLEEVLDRKIQHQWQLAATPLKPEDEATKLAELDVLAQRAQTLREDLDETPRQAGGTSLFAELEDVQAALEADEAMLAFQIQPWNDFYDGFGGGAWVLAITRDSVQAFPLPETYQLLSQLELFLGLFENRESFEQAQKVAVLIHQNLLGDALNGLHEDIKRLWLIPDNILHKIPFGVLRAGPEEPTVAENFQLTIIPSATLWLKWRKESGQASNISALSLSDPSLPDSKLTSLTSSLNRDGSGSAQLGRLPFARLEGRALMANMGGSSKLLLGDEASEAFVKKADLKEFGLLHFAAHALAGDELRQDSAVVLAPGDGEDGWLRPNEILNLDLDGQVVVLSACQSASGAIFQGEGVMSLGRAFFQAGAHVVVGSLWKLRDDDAAHLFGAFYKYLGKGLSVSQAMREAQKERMRAGAPVAAWSGVTVLGNGDLVPIPGGRSASIPRHRYLIGAFVVLSLLFGFWLSWRHRHAKATASPGAL